MKIKVYPAFRGEKPGIDYLRKIQSVWISFRWFTINVKFGKHWNQVV